MSIPVILVTLLLCVISFFICAIPTGLIFAKYLAGVDVREVGSHNIGSTNVARSAGGKIGALTLLADMLKGLVCTLVSRLILSGMIGADNVKLSGECGVLITLIYVCCVAGHCFSPYLHFNGGKGIAVGCGAGFGFMPLVSLGLLGVFGAVVLASQIVSLASICAAISLPFLALFMYGARIESFILLGCVSCLVIWRHRENIRRLARGEEKKFSLKK